jgi:hypothetical protein
MKPQVKTKVVAMPHLAEADKAFARGQEAYLDWCRELALAYKEGEATQQEIADRYEVSQQGIDQAIKVGIDNRLTSNTSKLPKSQYTLYLLTTLSDEAFEELCKPDTTQAKILEYKRRLAAPKPVTRPPCPGKEGTAPGEWEWTSNEWCQHYGVKEASILKPLPVVSAREWLRSYLLHCSDEAISRMLEAVRRVEHPDKGGSLEKTAIINKYLSERKQA